LSYNPNYGTGPSAVQTWTQRITMAIAGDPEARAALAQVTGRPDATNILLLADLDARQIAETLGSMVSDPDSWGPGTQRDDQATYSEFERRVIGVLLLVADRIRRDAGY
jgi:hypothetical protein